MCRPRKRHWYPERSFEPQRLGRGLVLHLLDGGEVLIRLGLFLGGSINRRDQVVEDRTGLLDRALLPPRFQRHGVIADLGPPWGH